MQVAVVDRFFKYTNFNIRGYAIVLKLYIFELKRDKIESILYYILLLYLLTGRRKTNFLIRTKLLGKSNESDAFYDRDTISLQPNDFRLFMQ